MTNGLGRGLSSLIPQKVNKKAVTPAGDAVVDLTTASDKGRILELPPKEIAVNPRQPRHQFADKPMEELINSIKEYGIIQPLIVTKTAAGYELIAGERRLRAAQSLGLKTVPVIVRAAGEQEKLEVALIENIQREGLNPIELALAYRKLIDEFNISQEELARRIGKARPTVTNTLRLLNLPRDIQNALIEGRITEGHAKILVGLDSEEKQNAMLKDIMRQSLTVGKAMVAARVIGGTKKARIRINYGDKDKEFAFRDFFGTKVEIKRKGKGGQVIIDFYSDEELLNMVGKIKK
jgi:ParB family transcriptional regulator, chromosome partitioning protein